MMAETTSTAAARPSPLRLKVELWAVVLLMGAAFATGVLAAPSDPAPPAMPETLPRGFMPQAPPLSDEELGSDLPDGHPPVEQPAPGGGDAAEAPEDSTHEDLGIEPGGASDPADSPPATP